MENRCHHMQVLLLAVGTTMTKPTNAFCFKSKVAYVPNSARPHEEPLWQIQSGTPLRLDDEYEKPFYDQYHDPNHVQTICGNSLLLAEESSLDFCLTPYNRALPSKSLRNSSSIESTSRNQRLRLTLEQIRLLRESTSIAAACLIAGLLVYSITNNKRIIVDALHVLCGWLRSVFRFSRLPRSICRVSKIATCMHGLRDVALVYSAVTVVQINAGRMARTSPTFLSVTNQAPRTIHNKRGSWLTRIKATTLRILPALDVLLCGLFDFSQLNSVNELLYFMLVTASNFNIVLFKKNSDTQSFDTRKNEKK